MRFPLSGLDGSNPISFVAGGMPLAFTQEDFLVIIIFRYEFQCAAGLAFDPVKVACEWPKYVTGCH